ncbi:putative pyridine nucleotide-disulphide oxidoreductase [Lyophyllum shimeji]|uniref:Pyridine nucleotide-disulphide oxidoreductase n=1 Tax=Lyophyllum shimeji TaxID=47721 RepID=A0A9P3PFV0_LYOSH|nr:putative pyridine nucleotide-disulphide oxidoreductase [Lyophyllum shimeji]
MLSALRLARARPFCFRPASLHSRHRFPRFSTSDATVAQAGPPGPTRLDRAKRYARYAGLFTLSSALGVFVIGAGIFIHDVFTYSDKHIDGVPISPLGVQPGRGGPKNLPIARVRVEDEEIEQNARLAEKPRLVIVGGGWGAMGILKTLAPGDYHVTLVSPETYTTFTPLLPSAAVGTVQLRSLIEPLRKMIARLHGHYLEGKAVDLVMSERLVEIEGIGGDHFYIPYDKLVIAVGATSSTHGVPGLENCFQLKTIEDAKNIRRRILDNFERASLPTTTREERKRLLSFVICGGGPTGVETAAEIEELCREDIIRYFPKICREDVSIHVVQSREHILNTYSEAISEYAEKKFQRDGIDLITGARVEAVTDDSVTYIIKDPEGKVDTRTIPTNFVLWSTGIAMNPFAQRVSDLLPNQVHKRAIVVDAHLRVKGAPLGEVYAIGDCSTIETSLVEHFMELVNEADKNKDGKIDFEEWKFMVENIKARMPMSEIHLQEVRELFEAYDKDRDNILSLNELLPLLQSIEQRLTALPATAQVASQEGKYVGRKLHRLARQTHAAQVNGLRLPRDEDVSRPFKYFHLGNLAYIGNAAVFDYHGYSLMGGLAAMYAWRSIYWNEQVSTRTRGLLMIDWIIRGVWGRDLSRL